MAAGRWRVHQSKFHRAGVLNVLPHSVSVAPACIHSETFNAKCRKQHLASAQSRLGGHNYNHGSRRSRQGSQSLVSTTLVTSPVLKSLRWANDIPRHLGGTD